MNLTRKESNGPHIVVYFQAKGLDIDLIIKNVGKITAKNVKIISTPPLENSKGWTYNHLMENIPSFPPGFEMVSSFDKSTTYHKKFQKWIKYNITVTFTDIYTEKIKEEYILDLRHSQDIRLSHRHIDLMT